jgi:hypothetical protein
MKTMKSNMKQRPRLRLFADVSPPREWNDSQSVESPDSSESQESKDVKLYRTKEGKPKSNVPIVYRDFLEGDIDNWGYGGSGPFYLARDILHWFGLTDPKRNWHWAASFIDEFLYFLPKEGALIPRQAIEAFVSNIRSEKCPDVREQTYDERKQKINEREAAFLLKGRF